MKINVSASKIIFMSVQLRHAIPLSQPSTNAPCCVLRRALVSAGVTFVVIGVKLAAWSRPDSPKKFYPENFEVKLLMKSFNSMKRRT